VSPGHLLLVPRRHVPTWFDATAEERAALMAGVDRGRERSPAATPRRLQHRHQRRQSRRQTVFHLHVHLIPRYGRRPRPRGGVRHVIPARQLPRPNTGAGRVRKARLRSDRNRGAGPSSRGSFRRRERPSSRA
jgi:diadenosine tetraphosphate (Ap4A) HIT family hydrolase